MLTRLCSVSGRMRPALFILALVALLLPGCMDAWQGAAAGRGTGALDYLLFCAMFNVCF
jgi:hypothetical protein